MNTATFLNQAASQIELGYPDEAIARLMVMLDLAAEESDKLDEASTALVAHPLFALLRQDPALAIAQCLGPDRINRLVSQISRPEGGSEPTPTGQTLNRFMAASTFNRAICARVKHADELLTRAWQDGRTIAVLGESFDQELAGLHGRELSNLTITASSTERAKRLAQLLGPSAAIAELSVTDTLKAAGAARTQFDLIYLPRAAETMDAHALARLLDQGRAVLAPTGSIVAPAFLAGRIARGWQQACLNWPVQNHSEVALAATCESEKLQIRMIGDQAGCFVWLVASQPSSNLTNWGKLT